MALFALLIEILVILAVLRAYSAVRWIGRNVAFLAANAARE
jgi:hypothetical protein